MLKGNGRLGLVVTLVIGSCTFFVSAGRADRPGEERRAPTPLVFTVLDTNTTLSHNDVYSIGSQRQYGTYEVPIGITNNDSGDVGLVDVNIALSADDWIVEQDPTGQMLNPGETAYLRLRLQTNTTSSSALTCPVVVTSSAGSTSFDPFVFTLSAASVDAEDEVADSPDLGSGTGSTVPSWPMMGAAVTLPKPAANFTRAPHQFIGWDLDTNAATTDSFYLGVHAAMEGGINRVEFYLNGTTTTVTEEVMEPGVATADGVPGYYVEIDPANFTGTDVKKIEVYARVFSNAGQSTASSAKIVPRIIGPWIGWVFPSGVAPYEIDCTPSVNPYAHDDDLNGGGTPLWEALLALSNSSSYGGVTLSGAPDKPIVLNLAEGNHVLPSSSHKYWVDNGSTLTLYSMQGFANWDMPLVIHPDTNADPEDIDLYATARPSTEPATDWSGLRVPYCVISDLTFDQANIAALRCTAADVDETRYSQYTFLDCVFTDSNGPHVLYDPFHEVADNPTHAGTRPPEFLQRLLTSPYADMYLEGGEFTDIHRGVVNTTFVRNVDFTNIAGSMSNNVQVMFNVHGEDINPSPYRRDVPVGVLEFVGAFPSGTPSTNTNQYRGVRKAGGNTGQYSLNPLGTDVASGALLLYDQNNSIPTYIIALDGRTSCLLPDNWTTVYPNLCNTGWYSVTTLAELVETLESIAANDTDWTFTRDSCGIGSSFDGVNGIAAIHLTTPCVTGVGGFPLSSTSGIPDKDTVGLLTTAVDVHTEVFQWFQPGGFIDNRTYWGIDYVQENEPGSDPVCTDYGCREVNYTGAFQILQSTNGQGVYNSSITSVRLTMRDDVLNSFQPASLSATMQNVLLSNLTLDGVSLATTNHPSTEPANLFAPKWVTIRDSYIAALTVKNPIADSTPTSSWNLINFNSSSHCTNLASGSPTLTVFGTDRMYVANCHYDSACQLESYATNGTVLGMYCGSAPSSMTSTTQDPANSFNARGTYPLNDDGRCSWGHLPKLSSNGNPIISQSPLLNRVDPPHVKFYLGGSIIDSCDPIGALPAVSQE
ncbi:MAG: hypothetical protein H6815_05965 [Phycisphaeraceae bacterium]|nr:hypothetical protein [Phycisphaerales bacterium]MCB9859985.1 hypothetical protein [Phycisphaeraceae bacterium]